MIYTISNGILEVKVSSLGAEMQSIKSLKTGTEYLWQGNPQVWKGRSPILFPLCGRVWEGKCTYQGKEYEINTHGFARAMEFSLKEQTSDAISLYITSNEDTKKSYPFDFNFIVTFSLEDSRLNVSFSVLNLSNGELPFSLGGHPGFNAPFIEGESIEDYFVEFSPSGNYVTARFTSDGYDAGYEFPFDMEDGKIFRINDNIFTYNDSAFVPNPPLSMTLKSTKNSRYVKVSAEGMTYMGLWKAVKEGANFICIEPWLGFPAKRGKVADFATKAHLIHLGQGKTFNTGYQIEIGE